MKPKVFKLLSAVCASAFLLLFVSACGPKKSKTLYPFKDGETFSFEKIKERTGGVKMRYDFKVEKQGSDFIIRRFQTAIAPNGEKATTQLTNSEKAFNKYGEMKKRANGESAGRCRGHYCQLWLVPDLRKVGAKVEIAEFGEPATIVSEEQRDGKTVLLATYRNAKLYYDKNSGYLVERGFHGKLVPKAVGPVRTN